MNQYQLIKTQNYQFIPVAPAYRYPGLADKIRAILAARKLARVAQAARRVA